MRRMAGLAALAATVAAAPALAQPPPRQVTPVAAATPSTTTRLIELLIQNGVLTREQADLLLRQAAAEEAAARRATPAARAPVAIPVPLPPAELPIPAGTVRVPYVSEGVRAQIREEVRRDVLTRAEQEGWARPGSQPEWTQRVRLFGDIRLRTDITTFPSGNAPVFVNYNSINNGNPVNYPDDVLGFGPYLNVTDDRVRQRLRARIGAEAQIADEVTGVIRLATGSDSSPVSTNQTFGQNGTSFSKYQIWLDQAYLRFRPAEWLTVDAGRMPNPFFTTDLLYDDDLNFDGLAARARRRLNDRFTGFATVGAFPYFNTDFNFATADFEKQSSRDRYLAAIQGGVDWAVAPNTALRFGVGYYNFINAEGSLSQPCDGFDARVPCSTDQSRSFFTQNTNTLIPIRRNRLNPNDPTNSSDFQYFGLASRFQVLDVNAKLDVRRFAPYLLSVEANYLRNLAFNRSRIEGFGVGTSAPNGIVNNTSAADPTTGAVSGTFAGGPNGYLLRASFGHPAVDERWNWNVSFAYRYLESDAVLDAFTDSDFRLGGTNSRGFVLGGALGIARNTSIRARYLSGEEVSGAPYRADVLQFDLQSRF